MDIDNNIKPPSVSAIKQQKKLHREVGKAIADYGLIKDGDTVMACLSGGKDSYTMLDMLIYTQKRAPVQFRLLAAHLDQKQPGHDPAPIADFCNHRKIDFHCIDKDTYSIVTRIINSNKTMCGLCSRLRRGTLYGYAEKIGANVIALGHHREDIVETFFLNLFFGSTTKAMPVKLLSKSNILVIRPLAYCAEREIINFARRQQYPIIPCNLCGSQENLQRQKIKAMLAKWESETPGRTQNIFRALANIHPSQMLDSGLFQFEELHRQQQAGNKVIISQ